MTNVATDNEEYTNQTALTEYMIHQFKDFVGGATQWTLTWNGKSTQSPGLSIVKLQIYNYNTDEWVDVDSDNATAANLDFNLNGNITENASYYKDDQQVITCRVLQEAL